MYRLLGNIPRNRDTKVKVKGQILNFIVNAAPPKPSDVATSNFVAEYVT